MNDSISKLSKVNYSASKASTNDGNVVIGFTSDSVLMLDCDLKREDEVKEFSEEYSKFHDLGSALVMKTSNSTQVDLYGHALGNYCIVFGKILSWEEIMWHIKEAYRLGMVNKSFVAIREFGSTTIRVNPKNKDTPHPEFVSFFPNGDNTSIIKYLEFWDMNKDLGG